MAGVNATAPLSLMVGVAVATTIAVSAILAGPALLDCSTSALGLGACLHAELARIVPAPSESRVVTNVAASEPSGQLEAVISPVAGPSAPPPVALAGQTGTLIGDSAGASRVVAEISLAPAAGSVAASSDPDITGAIGVELSHAAGNLEVSASVNAALPVAVASLAQEAGALEASSPQPSQTADASIDVSGGAAEVSAALAAAPDALAAATVLSDAQGSVSVSTGPPVPDVVVSAELAPASGQLDANGAAPPASAISSAEIIASSVEVTAVSSPSAASDVSVLLLPAPSTEPVASSSVAPSSEMSAASSSIPPPQTPPDRIPLKSPAVWASPLLAGNDPRFPNVVALPAPSGSDNSVVTLQLN